MSIAVETVVSTRRVTKEQVRVESLIPQQINQRAQGLIDLLRDYYSYLNEQGNPSYEIANIREARDIDEADYPFLDKIQKEIAVTVPKNIVSDRVTLYKNLMRYYSVRGSADSITLFFKILFNDNVEVYYPKKDMLIPSSGGWDKNGSRPIYDETGTLTGYAPGNYIDNRGFLSDTIKLQDSYFYQQFSYVIRTGTNVSTWKDAFNRLVHPAGFIFFGEILLFLEGINHFSVQATDIAGQDEERIASSMRTLQPGLIADEDIPWKIIISPAGGDNPSVIQLEDITGVFDVGEVVEDSTTGATAPITEVNGFYIMVNNPTGRFLGGSTLTGLTNGGTATVVAEYQTNLIKRVYYDYVAPTTASLADVVHALYIDVTGLESGADQLKFFDDSEMQEYRDITIEDADTNGLYSWDDLTVNDLGTEIVTGTSSGTSGTDFTVGETVYVWYDWGSTEPFAKGVVYDWSSPNLSVVLDTRNIPTGTILEGQTSGTLRIVESVINNSAAWNGVDLYEKVTVS